MSNAKIKEVSTAKYLGVTINNHLTWSNHIDNICHKALSVKSFLQRNLTSCPPNIKLLCYITMVRSILEYASPVWSLYTKQDINRLEKVRQSARFIMGDYSSYSSVSDMLKRLQLPSLEHRRSNASIILLYKTINNLISISSDDLIPLTLATRGHQHRFCHIYTQISSYHHSFFPQIIRLWNSLPSELVEQRSLAAFKRHLNSL